MQEYQSQIWRSIRVEQHFSYDSQDSTVHAALFGWPAIVRQSVGKALMDLVIGEEKAQAHVKAWFRQLMFASVVALRQ